MIEANGTLEASDYVRAQYLNMRPRRTYMVLGLVVLSLFLWAIWYTFFGGGPRGMTGYVLLAAAAYLILNFFVYIPWKARKTFRQQKSLQREMTLRFDDSGLAIEAENSQGRIPWSDFLKWKENDRLFLLYISDPLYHMVPKRLFKSSSEVDSVREVMRTHIGPSSA